MAALAHRTILHDGSLLRVHERPQVALDQSDFLGSSCEDLPLRTARKPEIPEVRLLGRYNGTFRNDVAIRLDRRLHQKCVVRESRRLPLHVSWIHSRYSSATHLEIYFVSSDSRGDI